MNSYVAVYEFMKCSYEFITYEFIGNEFIGSNHEFIGVTYEFIGRPMNSGVPRFQMYGLVPVSLVSAPINLRL